jgi:hypothetical protein
MIASLIPISYTSEFAILLSPLLLLPAPRPFVRIRKRDWRIR